MRLMLSSTTRAFRLSVRFPLSALMAHKHRRRSCFLQLQSKHVVVDDTGRAAREHISGELSLEKAFGGSLCVERPPTRRQQSRRA